jgi:hypothetical protein
LLAETFDGAHETDVEGCLWGPTKHASRSRDIKHIPGHVHSATRLVHDFYRPAELPLYRADDI